MSTPTSQLSKAAREASANPSFWGKWGALNPKWAQQYVRQAYNRGYGQPVITGRYAAYEEPSTLLTYFARRYDFDWLKLIAMRVDAQRTPLMVLKRQIWLARIEYWARRYYARKSVNRAAKVEWAYIKARLSQPFTWTGHDILHCAIWGLNVWAFFSVGEAISRQCMAGYPVATPEWTPARPKFAPGFYHVYDPFESYPFENQPNFITKQFQRSSWWHNSKEIYWAPHRMIAGYHLG